MPFDSRSKRFPLYPQSAGRVARRLRTLAALFGLGVAALCGGGVPVHAEGDWPADAADDLPMAGIFYGVPKGGLVTGNSTIAVENAIRFRAERSGLVDAVRFHNRTLSDENIESRCEARGPGSVWCDCVEADLDRYTCGYTLGNSYSVGNGGRISVEIREDDGSDAHLPAPRALGTTSPYVPMETDDRWPTLEFLDPVELVAGRIYHVVFANASPPSRCQLMRQPVEEASDCPRDEGAIALNGTWHGTDPSGQSRFGPFRGRLGVGALHRAEPGGEWRERPDAAPFYELRYADGEFVGDAYAGVDNLNYGEKTGTHTIEGEARGRQAFTVEDASREVDGLWLQFGHVYDRPVSGEALRVELKDDAGVVLGSGEVEASPECSRIARAAWPDGKRADWMCRTWGYAEIDTPVMLKKASAYTVEFSAPEGAGFDLSTFFSVTTPVGRNIWQSARAEFSGDAGESWALWGNDYRPDRDLAVMFTLVGMPKRLP